jgi:hypothetical protein
MGQNYLGIRCDKLIMNLGRSLCILQIPEVIYLDMACVA